MNPLETLMLEGIPRGFLPPADNGDGPTAWFQRHERQRLLWQLAHGDDEKLIHNSSADCVPVDDMNATLPVSPSGFPVEQEAAG